MMRLGILKHQQAVYQGGLGGQWRAIVGSYRETFNVNWSCDQCFPLPHSSLNKLLFLGILCGQNTPSPPC